MSSATGQGRPASGGEDSDGRSRQRDRSRGGRGRGRGRGDRGQGRGPGRGPGQGGGGMGAIAESSDASDASGHHRASVQRDSDLPSNTGGSRGGGGGEGEGRGRGAGRGRGIGDRGKRSRRRPDTGAAEQGDRGDAEPRPGRRQRRRRRPKGVGAGREECEERGDVPPREGGTIEPTGTSRASANGVGAGTMAESSAIDEEKKKKTRKSRTKKVLYPDHHDYADCLARYAANDPTLIRGKLRVMPKKDGLGFVSCDRGSLSRDVLIENTLDRNRAMDGDYVFVELVPFSDEDEGMLHSDKGVRPEKETTLADFMEDLALNDDAVEDTMLKDEDFEDYDIDDNRLRNNNDVCIEDEMNGVEMWDEDEVQKSLWNPLVKVRKKAATAKDNSGAVLPAQSTGRVVYIIPPKSGVSKQASELNPSDERYRKLAPRRTVVGTLVKLPGPNSNGYLLAPNNKSLPRFMCPFGTREAISEMMNSTDDNSGHDDSNETSTLYRADYIYNTWGPTKRWPPCVDVRPMGGSCNVEDETTALLVEHGVDHGDFSPAVLKDVEKAVRSGRVVSPDTDDLGWKPTKAMYRGRRDYRKTRIFTIDPTTAKDLDDALHISPLPDGRVEIGVHIADVSHFVLPDTACNEEAARRATTVYLVDRTVPMLPRPLCEIACSLNENVERLAFSCVWRMNMDGTLENKGKKKVEDEVWYGRTVIKSCARLDYATAQNIIDKKVATGERVEDVDETLWPKRRQPTGCHTIDEVAADVRLMHRIAMARRALRFQSGALALNGIKLAFQLNSDGETPELCEPYPIRDSNRLIEEYMLLANYLVAQRLITHANGLALLRHHPPPIEQGLQNVVDIAKESVGFDIDATSSQTLQDSLSRLGRACKDELVMQCVTELAMTPMQPAEYMAAGEVNEENWRHFALNIPYYTHFTSPIRRYADVMVHRLLQATIDGQETVDNFPQSQADVQSICGHCNEKKMASKRAQERSDRVFLSLYLRANPMESVLGVVLSVGEKTFTVFVPSLGLNTLVFLSEHEHTFKVDTFEESGKRRIVLTKRGNASEGGRQSCTQLNVKIFAKLKVSCYCKEKPPIDVKVMVTGPWEDDQG